MVDEKTMRAWAAEFARRYPDEAPDEVKFRAFLRELGEVDPASVAPRRVDLACSLLRVSPCTR